MRVAPDDGRSADGPVQAGTGFSHLVVQVDEIAATIEALSQGACSPALSGILPAWTARGHRGSPPPTATGSSWCSGRPGIPTGSTPPTSPKNAPRRRTPATVRAHAQDDAERAALTLSAARAPSAVHLAALLNTRLRRMQYRHRRSGELLGAVTSKR